MKCINVNSWCVLSAIQVANADVRTNAATLLLDVFPLQDHYQNKQDQEEALQRQFTIMKVMICATINDLTLPLLWCIESLNISCSNKF